MTTTASKRGMRASAEINRAKHAQRTALPPREAQDVLQAAKAAELAGAHADRRENPYGRMTVPELRARLNALTGGKASSRLNKGQLMNHILEAERKAQTQEAVHGPAQAEIANAPAVVSAAESNGEPKGSAKADKLQNALHAHGWAFSARNYDGDRVEAVLVRGSEVLTVVWHGGVFSYDETGHLVGDRHTKVRNVSAAIKLGSRSTDEAERELDRVVANRRFKPSTPRGVPAQRRKVLAHLDLETATQEELAASLAGMVIEWINRVANTTETATVSKNPKFFRVVDREDGRTIQFTSDTGFRACRLDQIVRVGGSQRRRSQPKAA